MCQDEKEDEKFSFFLTNVCDKRIVGHLEVHSIARSSHELAISVLTVDQPMINVDKTTI